MAYVYYLWVESVIPFQDLKYYWYLIWLMYRLTKKKRAAGVLDNYDEGKKYAEHSLRKFVRKRNPEIMPKINSFFADPK